MRKRSERRRETKRDGARPRRASSSASKQRKTLRGPPRGPRDGTPPRPRGDRASAGREAATATWHTEEPVAAAAARLASPGRRPRARSRSRASRGLGETPRRFAMRGTGLRRATRDARRPRDRPPRGKRHRGRYGHAPCWRAGTAFVAARVKEGESGASGRLLRIGEREGFCDLFGGYTVSYGAQLESCALRRNLFSQIYFSGFRHCVRCSKKEEK
jgi:hypothetical protein